MRFHSVESGFIWFITRCGQVFLGFTRFEAALPSFTEFEWVFTEFYWILLDFTSVFFTELYLVVPTFFFIPLEFFPDFSAVGRRWWRRGAPSLRKSVSPAPLLPPHPLPPPTTHHPLPPNGKESGRGMERRRAKKKKSN